MKKTNKKRKRERKNKKRKKTQKRRRKRNITLMLPFCVVLKGTKRTTQQQQKQNGSKVLGTHLVVSRAYPTKRTITIRSGTVQAGGSGGTRGTCLPLSVLLVSFLSNCYCLSIFLLLLLLLLPLLHESVLLLLPFLRLFLLLLLVRCTFSLAV